MVKQILVNILMEHGGCSLDDATSFIKNLKRTGRLMEEYFG
jgi:sulfite reductase alpha subunit-like flavoprotein